MVSIMQTETMDIEKNKYNKGGPVSRFESSNIKEINVSSYIKKSFKDIGCLGFL